MNPNEIQPQETQKILPINLFYYHKKHLQKTNQKLFLIKIIYNTNPRFLIQHLLFIIKTKTIIITATTTIIIPLPYYY
jgi:hypothetical protein